MKAASSSALALSIILFTPTLVAWEWSTPSGHVKYQWDASKYPDDSVFNSAVGDRSNDHLIDSRWKFRADKNTWDAQIHYQLQAIQGDRFKLAAASGTVSNALPSDDTRLFDLSKVVSNDADTAILHRLDRFNIGYSGNTTVIRFGRQVVSWGNGLLFNPMDFFNPFNPTALDKEYKTGDDMLYGQHLFNSGADLQGAWVIRRDAMDGDVDQSASSVAIKYHLWLATDNTLLNNAELDVLLSQHYDDEIVGLGLVKSIGGAVWRGDILLTHTDSDTYTSLVTNLSYSWVWNETNWSGALEYYYNGFGFSEDDYTLLDIQSQTDLLQRLTRGELYSTGRHYLGASATIELTPLILATPVLFFNLNDSSALLQLSGQYNLAQNWLLTTSLNIPLGSDGSEYSGLATGFGNSSLARDISIFFQLGFYF